MEVVSNLLLAPMPQPRHASDMIPHSSLQEGIDVQHARESAIYLHQQASELIHLCAQIRGIDCNIGVLCKDMAPPRRAADGGGDEVTIDEYLLSNSGGIEGRPYWWALRSSH